MTTFLLTTMEFIKTLFQHIWLSVSSIRFYQNVFLNYRGWGIKYIVILAFISSFCCSIILLYYTNNIKQYLEGNDLSKFANIEYILQQLPEFDYDGNAIIFDQDKEPVLINNLNNQTVIAIDPFNKATPTTRVETPIVLYKERLNINILDKHGKLNSNIPVTYASIFGNNPQILTKETIKSNLLQLFNKSSHAIIFVVFPILVLFIVFHVFWENIFLFFIILLFIKISKSGNSLKDGIRIILFSNGFFVLFQFLLLVGSVELNYIIWIIQVWSSFLMIAAVIRSTPKFTTITK